MLNNKTKLWGPQKQHLTSNSNSTVGKHHSSSEPAMGGQMAETDTQSRVCLPVDISHLVPGAIFMAAESQNKQNTNDWCQDSRASSYFPPSPELQGNFQENLKWGEGFCPFSLQREAMPTSVGMTGLNGRQESRNCLWPAPSTQQVLLLLCSILHLSTPLLQLCWDLSAYVQCAQTSAFPYNFPCLGTSPNCLSWDSELSSELFNSTPAFRP